MQYYIYNWRTAEITPKEVHDFQNACTNKDNHAKGAGFDFSGWSFYDRDREMYQCVELALAGKCADIITGVPKDNGFELLRRLARKFDPVSSQAVSIYRGRVYAFAALPCQSWKATQGAPSGSAPSSTARPASIVCSATRRICGRIVASKLA